MCSACIAYLTEVMDQEISTGRRVQCLQTRKQMPNVHLLSKEGVGESQPFDIKSKMSRNDEKCPSLSSLMKR